MRYQNTIPNICLAASAGDKIWLDFLIGEGTDVNQCDDYGETPIFYAVKSRQMKKNDKHCFVRELLCYGADPNIQNGNDETVLYAAIREIASNKLSKRTLKLIVDRGAVHTVQNEYGLTPADMAYRCNLPDLGDDILFHREGTTMMLSRGLIANIVFTLTIKGSVAYQLTNLMLDDSLIESEYHRQNERNFNYNYLASSLEPLVYENPRTSSKDENEERAENSSVSSSDSENEEHACPICCAHYEAGVRIHRCKCHKVFCGRCKLKENMDRCPFCGANVLQNTRRDFELEEKVRQRKNRSS